jgi:hypothetical protein
MTAEKKSPTNDNQHEKYQTEVKKFTENIKNTRNILAEFEKIVKDDKEYYDKDYNNDYRSTEFKITEKISLNDIFNNENSEINQTHDTSQKMSETDSQVSDILGFEV